MLWQFWLCVAAAVLVCAEDESPEDRSAIAEATATAYANAGGFGPTPYPYNGGGGRCSRPGELYYSRGVAGECLICACFASSYGLITSKCASCANCPIQPPQPFPIPVPNPWPAPEPWPSPVPVPTPNPICKYFFQYTDITNYECYLNGYIPR
ncbi:uncharacterized protein LOC112054195 [Bicyclus anynana]|uniref:Uncharacterized protein LOC112054195 n=1 Tax=Bicyclus anynana TaxID=110368 RepID=A0ABM3LZ47_BICAN|nr:uncharacterized protein LOC112054195 [Bicyclus anynana]